jgi:hypothetical protein
MLSKRLYTLYIPFLGFIWMPQNCPSHQALGKALPFTMLSRPSDFITSHAFVKVLLCNVLLVYVSRSEPQMLQLSEVLLL